MQKIDYSVIPSHSRDELRRYVEHGTPPGSFLRAVLANDLVGACLKSDLDNRRHIQNYAEWLQFDAPKYPYKVWGSYEIVDAWVKQDGMLGCKENN